MSIVKTNSGEVFRISHPTGYVEVQIDGFFPCPVPQGKKLFKMARKFCTKAEQVELHDALLRLFKCYPGKISEAAQRLGISGLSNSDFEKELSWLRRLRRNQTVLELNIRDAAGILDVRGEADGTSS